MVFLAGQTLTAAALNASIPQEFEAVASSELPIPYSTPADIAGCTITFTTTIANAVVMVRPTYDWRVTTTGTGFCYGEFAVDGVVDTRRGLFEMQSAISRLPGATTKKVVIATPGVHTIKLMAHKDINVGVAVMGGSTALNISLYG